MQGPHRDRRAEAGFSLLEVLVAFAILALSLGVLMQIFSKAMTVTVSGADVGRAAALAEACLETVGFEIPLEPGVYDGAPQGDLAWSVQIRPYPYSHDTAGEPALVPYLVVVDVLWRGDGGAVRRFRLPSLRLGAPPGAPQRAPAGASQ